MTDTRAAAIQFIKEHFPLCLKMEGEPYTEDIDALVDALHQAYAAGRAAGLREARDIWNRLWRKASEGGTDVKS